MTNVTHLIFDLDGTLIDSSQGVVEAVNYSLRMMGEPEQDAERIKAFIGYPLSEMYAHFTTASPKELYKHFQVKAAETIVASAEPLPHVEETLHLLKEQGYRMAIATSKIRANVDGILEKLNWKTLFDVTATADEVEHLKPAPDIFRLALKRLGAEPSRALVVGDTVNDVKAAKKVPIKVVTVDSPFGGFEKVESAKPDATIGSLAELPDLLKKGV